jgi:hypothetical protein
LSLSIFSHFLSCHSEKRLAELKEQKAKDKFGDINQIGQKDFVSEVSKADKDIFVVCHLFVHRFVLICCVSSIFSISVSLIPFRSSSTFSQQTRMSALEPMFGHCRKEVQSCQVCENNRK